MEWRRKKIHQPYSLAADLTIAIDLNLSSSNDKEINFEFQLTTNGRIRHIRSILWYNNYSNISTVFWRRRKKNVAKQLKQRTPRHGMKRFGKTEEVSLKSSFFFCKKSFYGFRVFEEWHFIFMEFQSPASSVSFAQTRSRFTHGTY